VAAYRQAIAAEPNFLPAHAALMASLLKQGKFADAATALDVMKKVAPKNPQTQLVEGQLHYQKKEFKQARDSVQEVLKVLPQYPPALVLAGAVNYQLNSLLEAEDFLSRAVKLSPELTMARRMLAAIYLRTSRPAKALALIEPVLDNADNDGDLLSLAGEIYMQNGKPQKAEEYFSKAAVLDPKNANKQTRVALTHFVEGKADIAYGELERIADADTGTTADMALIAAAIKQKDFGKAMKAIDALEKKQADNPLVYALRGTVLVAKGDTAGGRKSFEKALAVKPGYYPAAASLAGLDLADKKPDDAKKRFEGILSVDGKNLQALMALAELKARTGGSVDEVAAQLGKAMAANPDEQAPRLALVNLYLGNKDFKKALTVAQDAAAAMPDKVAILDALARAQQSTGDTNQALATYGKIASLMPASPQVFLRMAEINVAAKNNEAAIQSLRKALELKPDLIAAQRGLIMLYLESKNVPDAERVARDVKQQRPKEAVGFLFEGDIAAARKAWPEALAAYRAGLRQVPSTELAVKIYGALYAAGNAAEAEKFAAGWLVDHPRDAAFRSALAENAIARKEFATAIRQYQVLLQAQPNNPLILNNIAWTLGQLNDPKALDYAERALRIAPNQPAIMETAATLLVQKGDNARALDLMQKAMSLAPQAATLKLSLARVQIKAGKKADAQKNLEELAKLGEKFPAQAEVAKLQKEIAN
jgi:putative PEP-CTERM system TPR-repeat lipoprotein